MGHKEWASIRRKGREQVFDLVLVGFLWAKLEALIKIELSGLGCSKHGRKGKWAKRVRCWLKRTKMGCEADPIGFLGQNWVWKSNSGLSKFFLQKIHNFSLSMELQLTFNRNDSNKITDP